MTEKFTCPRRAENGMDRDDGPFLWSGKNLDEFKKGHGLIGQPSGCSYCGSMSGEDFMEAVKNGAEIGPTDKSYKFYVKGLPREGNPDDLRVLTVSSHPGEGLLSWSQLSKKQKKAVKESGRGTDYKKRFYNFTTWGPTVDGKFYTKHLTEEQGWEFAKLQHEGKIRWGYPGGPYVGLYIPGPSGATEEERRARLHGD